MLTLEALALLIRACLALASTSAWTVVILDMVLSWQKHANTVKYQSGASTKFCDGAESGRFSRNSKLGAYAGSQRGAVLVPGRSSNASTSDDGERVPYGLFLGISPRDGV